MDRTRKVIPFEIKEINEEERSFLAVGSTEDLDRDYDRILSAGWDLANFKKNPVIPWAHRYADPPVAQAIDVYMENGKLMFRPKFATKDEYAFADTIWNLYKGGYLRAFSVGFDPKRYEIVERDKDKKRRGYDFIEQELWEISACTVPSNPNALAVAKSKGVIGDAEYEQLTADEPDPGKDVVQDLQTDAEQQQEDPAEQPENQEETQEQTPGVETRLDAIEQTLARISARLEQKPEDFPKEEEEPQTQTPALDINQVVEALKEPLAALLRQKIDEKVEKRINYHLGIVI